MLETPTVCQTLGVDCKPTYRDSNMQTGQNKLHEFNLDFDFADQTLDHSNSHQCRHWLLESLSNVNDLKS